MIIYKSIKREFLNHVVEDEIVDKIIKAHRDLNYNPPGQSEVRSWKNSMEYMFKVLSEDSIPFDVGIAIEYRLPLTGNRIDFIISGSKDGIKSIFIIELKQWEEAKLILNMDAIIVETFLGKRIRETTHPSYQAWSYYKLILDYNEYVQKNNINLIPCAYLHNYKKEKLNQLDNNHYKLYIEKAPIFIKGDVKKLREFIKKNINIGDSGKLIESIDKSEIKISKSLQESLTSMLNGNKEFILIDSQKVAFEKTKKSILNSIKTKTKKIIIIEGGPGTGKSVIAINLLVELLNKNLIAKYVTKNATPRNVYSKKLKKDFKSVEIKPLFSSSGVYHNISKNLNDVLIVDEAHRLNRKSGMFKNLGENQIMEIINSSKSSIFFIDENQKVDINDIGTINNIKKIAKENNCIVETYKLDSQFRCNGSDGYISWLDDLLDISETGNHDGFNFNYEVKVFDNPIELKNAIFEKNEIDNKSRLVAGYCWNWLKDGREDSRSPDINIGNFHMSWNLGNSSTWAIDPESVNEIGCIHTCQGLEFDYVGVILGEDISFEDEKIITDFSKRANTDQSLKGIKKINKENPEKANEIADNIIKNTYRTLMTRGMKGCYIYCCNKDLSNHIKSRINNFKK